VSKKKGRDAEVESKESKNGEEVSVFITQVAAMSCAETQQPERTLASQRLRKVGLRKAVHIEVALIRNNPNKVDPNRQPGIRLAFIYSPCLYRNGICDDTSPCYETTSFFSMECDRDIIRFTVYAFNALSSL
jgi:hypothetical protein